MKNGPDNRLDQLAEVANDRLPDGWCVHELAEFVERPDYGVTASASHEPRGPKFLRITDIQNGTVNWQTVPYSSIHLRANDHKMLCPDDIVVARIGATTGKAFLISECPPAVFASYLIRIRTLRDKLNAKFLYYFLQTNAYWRHINRHKDDRLKGGVNIPILTSLQIPVPPLPEQESIAEILERTRIAILIEEKSEDIAHDLKSATMHALFTRGLRGEEQQETEIGPIPRSWTSRPIIDLCEILSGGTPRKSVAEYWTGSIPWASGKDLKVPTLDDTIDHLSQEGVAAGSRVVPSGTVLILVRGMGLAKDLPVSVISRPMAFNQDLKALVSRGEFSGKYIRSAIYFSKDRLLSKIVPSAHGTMTLNLDDIETFQVPCPSQGSEADEIVKFFDAIDHKIDVHKRKGSVLKGLFNALLHKLMTGEIRVDELDLSALANGQDKPVVEGTEVSSGPAQALT